MKRIALAATLSLLSVFSFAQGQGNGNGSGSAPLPDQTVDAWEDNTNGDVVLPSGNVGIGTTQPQATLDVKGDFRLNDGTQGDGKVLTTDADGNASWQTPSNNYTFQNGITESGGIVTLGGDLTNNTRIDQRGSRFILENSASGKTGITTDNDYFSIGTDTPGSRVNNRYKFMTIQGENTAIYSGDNSNGGTMYMTRDRSIFQFVGGSPQRNQYILFDNTDVARIGLNGGSMEILDGLMRYRDASGTDYTGIAQINLADRRVLVTKEWVEYYHDNNKNMLGAVTATSVEATTGRFLDELRVGPNSLVLTSAGANTPGGYEIYTDNSNENLFIQSNNSATGHTVINSLGGNVGIGTALMANPEEKLHVIGGALFETGKVKFRGSQQFYLEAAAIKSGLTTPAHYIGTDGTVAADHLPLVMRTNGNNRFIVEPDGNLIMPNVAGGRRMELQRDGGYLRFTNGTATTAFIPNIIGKSTATFASAGMYIKAEPASDDATNWGINLRADFNGASLAQADVMKVQNGTTTLMTVAASGDVGIGDATPQSRLEVWGSSGLIGISGINYDRVALFRNGVGSGLQIASESTDHDVVLSSTYVGGDMILATRHNGANHNRLTIRSDGKVGIGNEDVANAWAGNRLLYVDGGILCEELEVQMSGQWADYVFAKNYTLKGLEEVEAYINENHHLPNVPSAEEVEEEGIAVSEMLKIQMEKIEELTLYIIEQDKRIKELESK